MPPSETAQTGASIGRWMVVKENEKRAVTVDEFAPACWNEKLDEPCRPENPGDPTPEKKKLCIVGTASTMKQAPFTDDEYEIWGVSGLLGAAECTRLDRIFEIHPWYEVRSMLPLLGEMENSDAPIYMQEVQEEVPRSVKFPRDELMEMFHLDAMGDHLYVTNSVTWMILLGIYEGYTDFSLYGVHMAHDKEYAYQRASCSWALGIIHGKILNGEPYELYLPEESELMRAQYEYGYGQPTKLMMAMDIRRKRLAMGMTQVGNEIEAKMKAKYHTEGALEEAAFWHNYIAGYK